MSAARAAFALFLTYHALSVVTALVPSPSALADAIDVPFSYYRMLTGHTQYWSMFTSVPYRQSSEVQVWAIGASGLYHEHGPILPGLTDYDASEAFRYHTAFSRYALPGFENYLPGYACRVANELERETGVRPARVQVVLNAQRIRYLADIRKGGGTTTPDVWSSEQYEVGACED